MYHEANYFISHLRKLTVPVYRRKSISTINARLYERPEPLGPTLIITPFNYPFHLSIVPLIGVLAAGNPIMVKYSRSTPAVRGAVTKILKDAHIPEDVICLYDGPNDELFSGSAYALVVFTGSTAVGRKIYASCAPTLTKCVLELGGANPVLIADDADLKNAARNLTVGKFTNSGQTCICPNYCCFCGS